MSEAEYILRIPAHGAAAAKFDVEADNYGSRFSIVTEMNPQIAYARIIRDHQMMAAVNTVDGGGPNSAELEQRWRL